LWQGSDGTPAIWLMDGLSATDVAALRVGLAHHRVIEGCRG
jgi:hypothetical protein